MPAVKSQVRKRLMAAIVMWCTDLIIAGHSQLPLGLSRTLALQVEFANKMAKAILGKHLFNIGGPIAVALEVERCLKKLREENRVNFKEDVLISVKTDENPQDEVLFTLDELRIIGWAGNLMWFGDDRGRNGIDVLDFIEWAAKTAHARGKEAK